MIYILFLFCGVVWATYWTLVRPALLQKVTSDFEQLRSEIDWAIIDGLPQSHSQAAVQLASSLEFSSGANSLSLGVIMYFSWSRKAEMRARVASDSGLYASMPTWLKEAHQRDMKLTLKAALLNSPFWWPAIAVVALLTHFSQKVDKWWSDVSFAATAFKRSEFA